MTTTASRPIIILIAGHWLGAWAWDEVLEHLATDQSRAVAMTLPGLDGDDPGRAAKTLDDQAAAVLDVISQLGASGDQPATLVAHSGANAPVSLVLDRHPELVHRVVWVDSGPVAPGSAFGPGIPEELAELPLPPFDVLAQQASLDGLDPEVLERFRAGAVPEPGCASSGCRAHERCPPQGPDHPGVLLDPGRAGAGARPLRACHVCRSGEH